MSHTNGVASKDLVLARLEPACRLLAEARDAKDAKRVADLARAAEVYAQRQRMSEEAIASATTVKIDAMTLMGEFLKDSPKQDGGHAQRTRFQKRTESPPPPKLDSLGIGKKESSDAQLLVDLKAKKPELHEAVRAGEKKISEARVEFKSEVRKEQRTKELEKKAAEAAKKIKDASEQHWRIITGDCIAELEKLPPNSARLIFTDPPYNIGIDYGEGTNADSLPDSEYLPWCKAWMYECKRVLTNDGSLWVLIGNEYAAEFGCMLKNLGFTIRAWIKWYETFGVNQANNFNRCSRHLFYCVVDPKRFVFNAEAVNRPSDRQTKYGDSRANPGGKIWDDVWGVRWGDGDDGIIPRLVGTATERIPQFPTQLPLALLLPIVGCASDPGDSIIDPFCGSGTTGAASIKLGRRFTGIEKSKQFAELARKRLLAESVS